MVSLGWAVCRLRHHISGGMVMKHKLWDGRHDFQILIIIKIIIIIFQSKIV